jgi:two-component system sensor histidine kinase BarA
MSNLAVYDRSLAVERAGGCAELATDLFGMLLKELPGFRTKLLHTLERNDLASLERHAHKLHGSATYTGVSALGHAVATLENNLKRGVTEDVSQRVDAVVREIDRVFIYATSA